MQIQHMVADGHSWTRGGVSSTTKMLLASSVAFGALLFATQSAIAASPATADKSGSISWPRGAVQMALMEASPISDRQAPNAGDQAPPAGDSGLEEIVVTAQKREQGVQSVPIAISAVSGGVMTDRRVTDMTALAAMLPNVRFDQTAGDSRISIRGITFDNFYATGAEARVAYHYDGIYLSRSGNIDSTFFDVDRVEVLRGPQGTLFGRNAVAGAVNLITRAPTSTPQGYLQTSIGNYNAFDVEGAVGGPISDKVQARIAFKTTQHDGYGRNLLYDTDIDDKRQRAIRGRIKFEPTDALTLDVTADYSRENSHTGQQSAGYFFQTAPGEGAPLGGRGNDPDNPRNNYFDDPPFLHRVFYGVKGEINWEIADALKLVSLTSYRHARQYYHADGDLSSARALSPVRYGERSHQFSEELRIQKDFDRATFMAGGYYFSERYNGGTYASTNVGNFVPGVDFQTDAIRYGGRLKTEALAAFAEASYKLLDPLTILLGARYSVDKKSLVDQYFMFDLTVPFNPASSKCEQPCNLPSLPPGTAFQSDSRRDSNFSPRVTIQYKINASSMIYATFSKGFKSGGYNLGFTGGFDPEKITNFEGGFKGDLANGKLRVNMAGFYYDYTNLQVQVIQASSPDARIENAASAKVYGAELEAQASPVRNLRLDFSASVMHSEFTSFLTADPTAPQLGLRDLSGNRLPYAPKYTFSYGIQYAIESEWGKITPRAEGQTISNVFYDQYNRSQSQEGGYTLFNAFLNYSSPNSTYYGGLFVKNITQERRFSGISVSSGFVNYPLQATIIPPRTFGALIGARF